LRKIKLAVVILTLGVVCAALDQRRATAEKRVLFQVKKQGKYGCIDRNGKICIEPRFESAGAMEILVGYRYYEGGGAQLYQLQGDKVEMVLGQDWGL
jgi:hypothetical protein